MPEVGFLSTRVQHSLDLLIVAGLIADFFVDYAPIAVGVSRLPDFVVPVRRRARLDGDSDAGMAVAGRVRAGAPHRDPEHRRPVLSRGALGRLLPAGLRLHEAMALADGGGAGRRSARALAAADRSSRRCGSHRRAARSPVRSTRFQRLATLLWERVRDRPDRRSTDRSRRRAGPVQPGLDHRAHHDARARRAALCDGPDASPTPCSFSIVPRFLLPSKLQGASQKIFTLYTGTELMVGTRMGLGIIGEFYANFGQWGGVLGTFVYGLRDRLRLPALRRPRAAQSVVVGGGVDGPAAERRARLQSRGHSQPRREGGNRAADRVEAVAADAASAGAGAARDESDDPRRTRQTTTRRRRSTTPLPSA